MNSALVPEDGTNQNPINVSVVRNEKGVFEIYHNFNENQLSIKILLEEIYEEISPSPEDQAECITQFDKLFTSAYVTNASNPPFNAVTSRKQLQEIALTERTMVNVWNTLLSKCCRRHDVGIVMGGDPPRTLYDHLKRKIPVEIGQSILDVIYYNFLHKKQLENRILNNLCRELKVSSRIYEPENWGLLQEKFPFLKSVSTVISYLYSALFTEWVDYWKLDKTLIIGISDQELENCIHQLRFPNPSGFAPSESPVEALKIQKEHYKSAIEEIKTLEKIILKGASQNNKWPESDLAHKKWVSFNLLEKADAYWEFCEFVSNCAVAKYSFVLKYLVIDGIYLSSGERAIQNLFSWINLLPIFGKITGDSYKSLNKHLLLLIDEIDLYVHPEWQRQLISHLITQINEQFPDNKVQIILTTHSPFVLSDIPVENCIFLEPEEMNGEKIFAIASPEKISEQTFAANLHLI